MSRTTLFGLYVPHTLMAVLWLVLFFNCINETLSMIMEKYLDIPYVKGIYVTVITLTFLHIFFTVVSALNVQYIIQGEPVISLYYINLALNFLNVIYYILVIAYCTFVTCVIMEMNNACQNLEKCVDIKNVFPYTKKECMQRDLLCYNQLPRLGLCAYVLCACSVLSLLLLFVHAMYESYSAIEHMTTYREIPLDVLPPPPPPSRPQSNLLKTLTPPLPPPRPPPSYDLLQQRETINCTE